MNEKQCPFCSEPLAEDAIVCRHCGRYLAHLESQGPQKSGPLEFLWLVVGLLLPFIGVLLGLVYLTSNQRRARGRFLLAGSLISSLIALAAFVYQGNQLYSQFFRPSPVATATPRPTEIPSTPTQASTQPVSVISVTATSLPTIAPTAAATLPPVEPKATTSASLNACALVNLNIRSGPGTSQEKVSRLAAGDCARVYCQTEDSPPWVRSDSGWLNAAAQYLRIEGNLADLPVCPAE